MWKYPRISTCHITFSIQGWLIFLGKKYNVCKQCMFAVSLMIFPLSSASSPYHHPIIIITRSAELTYGHSSIWFKSWYGIIVIGILLVLTKAIKSTTTTCTAAAIIPGQTQHLLPFVVLPLSLSCQDYSLIDYCWHYDEARWQDTNANLFNYSQHMWC